MDDFAEALQHPLVDEVFPVGASHDQQLDGRAAAGAMGEPLLPVVQSPQLLDGAAEGLPSQGQTDRQ